MRQEAGHRDRSMVEPRLADRASWLVRCTGSGCRRTSLGEQGHAEHSQAWLFELPLSINGVVGCFERLLFCCDCCMPGSLAAYIPASYSRQHLSSREHSSLAGFLCSWFSMAWLTHAVVIYQRRRQRLWLFSSRITPTFLYH